MKKYLLTMLIVLAGSNMWAQTFPPVGGNEGKTLVITTDGDMTAQTYADNVSDKMKKGGYGYSKVIVNGNGTISEAFLRAILYINEYTANASLKNLDLTGITLKGWNSSSFKYSENTGWQCGQLQISKLGLPKAEDNKVPYKAFEAFKNAVTTLTAIVIPEGTKEIGKYAFDGIANLSSVSFPESLRKVDDCAFTFCKIENLKLNQGLEFIGNSAFALSDELKEKVLDIPASVKYIGPCAFNFRRYQDVYFHGEKAPLMPLGQTVVGGNTHGWSEVAFSTDVLHGNNGFSPESSSQTPYADNIKDDGKANRENYVNDGVYLAILHYPTGLSDEARAEYTDITRKYETLPENQAWDVAAHMEIGRETPEVFNEVVSDKWKNWFTNYRFVNPGYRDTYVGNQYIWPSQSQIIRSFCMNYAGYNWYGDTKYRSKLSEEDKQILAEAGYKIGNGAGEYTEDELAKIAHLGTRLFVFTDDDAITTPEFPLPIDKRGGGRWWTLCVPFNMTKKMVDESMGEGTQVCRFSSVTRKLDTDGQGRGDGNKGNHICLEFRHDVYKHKFERATDGTFHDNEWSEDLPACKDDDIVIYAHEAYMVKPTKTDENAAFVVKDYEPVPGSPIPTIIKAKETKYKNNSQSEAVNDKVGDYRFIGNYINTAQREAISVPVNCYFYGLAKKSDTKPAFWFWPYNSHLTWPSYKCTVETVNVELGEQDARDFFNFVAGFSASSKYQSSFFGDDELNSNETTSVDQVVIVAGDDDQAIYNLSGQLVSKNGNLDGLQKGVYVKGGKKFIVK